jgi:DNA-binding XRE family transcriptional regulator
MSETTKLTSDRYDFGQLVAMYRTRANLSRAELGNLLEVSVTTIYKWENSLAEPSLDNFKKLILIFLEKQAFTKGNEAYEARELWSLAKLSIAFDNNWFNKISNETETTSTNQEPFTNLQKLKKEAQIIQFELEEQKKIIELQKEQIKLEKYMYDLQRELFELKFAYFKSSIDARDLILNQLYPEINHTVPSLFLDLIRVDNPQQLIIERKQKIAQLIQILKNIKDFKLE